MAFAAHSRQESENVMPTLNQRPPGTGLMAVPGRPSAECCAGCQDDEKEPLTSRDEDLVGRKAVCA